MADSDIDSNQTNIVSDSATPSEPGLYDASIGEVISPINTVTTNPDAPFNQYVNST